MRVGGGAAVAQIRVKEHFCAGSFLCVQQYLVLINSNFCDCKSSLSYPQVVVVEYRLIALGAFRSTAVSKDADTCSRPVYRWGSAWSCCNSWICWVNDVLSHAFFIKNCAKHKVWIDETLESTLEVVVHYEALEAVVLIPSAQAPCSFCSTLLHKY